MKNTIWMRTSKDRLELPVAVADSAEELAIMCRRLGINPRATANSVRSGFVHNSPYIHKIIFDEEEENMKNINRGYLMKPPFEIYFNDFTEEYHVIEYLGAKETDSIDKAGEKIEIFKCKRIGTARTFAEAKRILARHEKGAK